MGIPDRLVAILDEEEDELRLESLESLNDELEDLWNSPPDQQVTENGNETVVSVAEATKSLQSALVTDVESLLNISPPSSDNNNNYLERWNRILDQQLEWKSNSTDVESINGLIRAGKNWLRWCLQILPALSPYDDSPDNTTLLTLQPLLEWCWWIVSHSGCPKTEKHAGQWLFYGLYSKIPSNWSEYWQSEQFLRELLLQIVCTRTSPSLFVLLQTLHLVMASSRKARGRVADLALTLVDGEPKLDISPWIQSSDGDVTSLLCDLLTHFVSSKEKSEHDSFIILESLRCIYALGIGANLQPDETLPLALLRVLQEGDRDAQLVVVSILTDFAPSVWSERLISLVHVFTDLLFRQADQIIQNQWVDNRSAAALVPCLTVLYRNCLADSKFWDKVHSVVFPIESEANFQLLLLEAGSKKKNMQPMDAPEGTLRGHLVKLLVWPQSHVKRLVAELLWSLCRQDAVEFSHRVGIGNALPTLSSKGLVEGLNL